MKGEFIAAEPLCLLLPRVFPCSLDSLFTCFGFGVASLHTPLTCSPAFNHLINLQYINLYSTSILWATADHFITPLTLPNPATPKINPLLTRSLLPCFACITQQLSLTVFILLWWCYLYCLWAFEEPWQGVLEKGWQALITQRCVATGTGTYLKMSRKSSVTCLQRRAACTTEQSSAINAKSGVFLRMF